MSEYFLKLPGDSQPRAYSEYEVREFLGQGVIDSKTLTWKQGMEGWQPVAQVLPPMSPVWEETQDQEGKDQPEEQQYRLRYPLNGLAKLSILACFVLLPFMLWSSWIVFSNNVVNYEEIQTLIQQNMVHLPSFAVPLVFLLSILFIPSLLIQLIWLYRASANIQEFQVQGIRFTPFLSVLLSCMPVVGMVLVGDPSHGKFHGNHVNVQLDRQLLQELRSGICHDGKMRHGSFSSIIMWEVLYQSTWR